MFIKECPWGQPLWKGGDESRSSREGSTTDAANTWGALELEWSLRGILSRAKMSKLLLPHRTISRCGFLGKGMTLDKVALCRWDSPWRGWQLNGCMSPALPAAETMSLSLKGNHGNVHHINLMLSFSVTLFLFFSEIYLFNLFIFGCIGSSLLHGGFL